MTAITLNDLTTGDAKGTGTFDKLMAATKAHLDIEYNKSALRGPEYATVYLGQLQANLSAALSFIATREKVGLEVALLEKQLLLADAQLAQTEATTVNLTKQGALIDAQTAVQVQEKINAVQQLEVLKAQECLLKAQYDATMATVLKSASETDLLKQKVVTEKAQTLELGVDSNSVVGKQKDLYTAQIAGFQRDAEQKAAKLWVDSWNARRMTDEGTVADGTNLLDDATGGRLMTKLLAGINA